MYAASAVVVVRVVVVVVVVVAVLINVCGVVIQLAFLQLYIYSRQQNKNCLSIFTPPPREQKNLKQKKKF
jgi:hypothetical protein